MRENNDTNADTVTTDKENGSDPEAGLRADGPTPIFVSFLYDFMKGDADLGGDGGGRPGTLGGSISGQEPKYKIYTYQYLPPVGENIGDA